MASTGEERKPAASRVTIRSQPAPSAAAAQTASSKSAPEGQGALEDRLVEGGHSEDREQVSDAAARPREKDVHVHEDAPHRYLRSR